MLQSFKRFSQSDIQMREILKLNKPNYYFSISLVVESKQDIKKYENSQT